MSAIGRFPLVTNLVNDYPLCIEQQTIAKQIFSKVMGGTRPIAEGRFPVKVDANLLIFTW